MQRVTCDAVGFLGRLLLASLFAAGSAQKLSDQTPVLGLLADRGWPGWLIWPATLVSAAGALCLVTGLWLRPAAIVLAAYCGTTSLFHFLPDDPWQMTIFVKNWAIAGGLLVLAAGGGGDWRMRR